MEESEIEAIFHARGRDGVRTLPSDEELDTMRGMTVDWLDQFQFSPTNGMKSSGDYLVLETGGHPDSR